MNRNKKNQNLTPLQKKRRRYIKRQRRMRIWSTFFCLILVAYVAVAAVGIGVIKYMTKDMPKLNITNFIGDESSNIYDADGNLIIELGTYFRENVSYNQMPESLVDAFLSIEDSRYFEHNGFDIPRFSAAAISNITSGDLTGQGGSTFTMQLVKNSYFSVDAGDESTTYSAGKGIAYKIQQIVLSVQLEQKLNKKQIFELYVNRLNFGQNIRGVEMASRYYFGKSVGQLNLSESALLAGIVNLPNTYNPYYYLDYATERRNTVLYMMLYHGYITEEEYNLAVSINIEDQLVGEYKDIQKTNSRYQEYIDVVLDEVVRLTGRDPYSTGMNIYTAMDPDIQNQIIAIESGSGGVTYADDLMQSAITTINHSTGEIVGIGGGRNYANNGETRLLNRAVSMYKQPGSTVKPVIPYALGFEQLGFSLDELVIDAEYSYPGEKRKISDHDGKYLGVMSIKDALADSRNIPAIMTLEKVTEKMGKENVVSYMQSLGFDSINNDNYHLSVAIGSNDFTATVTQIAAAHATMMNLGVYNKPHTITRVEMTNGDTYYPDGLNQRVLSSGSAYLVTELMRNNVTQSKYFNYMYILRRNYAVYAKTGTTDWDSSGLQYGIPNGSAKDEWMVSSNGKYTNAVWTGYDQAIAGQDTYFASWKLSMNIAGNINSVLIDKEAEIDGQSVVPVSTPSDLTSVTYVKDTWPHVRVGGATGSSITSVVSNTGLQNTPTIDNMKDSYRITKKGYVKGQKTSSLNTPTPTPKTKEEEEKTKTKPTPATEPDPTEVPVDPTPVDPTPVDPTPVDPTPVDPTPVDPTPVDPTPVDPTPVDPTPVDPTPVDPQEGA